MQLRSQCKDETARISKSSRFVDQGPERQCLLKVKEDLS